MTRMEFDYVRKGAGVPAGEGGMKGLQLRME